MAEEQNQRQNRDQENVISVDTAIKLLIEFDGNRKELLHEFLENCELAIHSVAERNRNLMLNVIKTKIRGKAKSAIRFRNFDTWNELREFLEDIYTDKRSLSHLQLELNSCRQGRSEGVFSFSQRLEKLLNSVTEISIENKTAQVAEEIVNLLKKQALNVFVEGLQHPLKLLIKARNLNDLETAIDVAVAEERSLLSDRECLKFFGYNKASSQASGKKCHICNKFGHLANSCYSKNTSSVQNNANSSRFNGMVGNKVFAAKLECFYCKKFGHTIAECRKRMFNEKKRNDTTQTRRVSVNQNSDKLAPSNVVRNVASSPTGN